MKLLYMFDYVKGCILEEFKTLFALTCNKYPYHMCPLKIFHVPKGKHCSVGIII